MSEIFESREQLIDWATGAGLRILIAVVAGIIASLLVQRLIRAAVRPRMLAPSLSDERDDERLRRREQTVESFLIQTSNTFITFATGMVALAELGVNVAPLIASAGIVGLAIGFGAQTLVKDAIAGGVPAAREPLRHRRSREAGLRRGRGDRRVAAAHHAARRCRRCAHDPERVDHRHLEPDRGREGRLTSPLAHATGNSRPRYMWRSCDLEAMNTAPIAMNTPITTSVSPGPNWLRIRPT